MSRLRDEIHRAEMAHSIMNGFNLTLNQLAEENDAHIERLESESAAMRGLIADMWWYGYLGYMESMEQRKQQEHICSVLDRMYDLGVNL